MANSLKSLIKTGFGISVGFFLSQILFIVLGLMFFIPGYLLFINSSDKNKSNRSLPGIILMAIGVIIMGGMGFGLLMNSIGDMSFE